MPYGAGALRRPLPGQPTARGGCAVSGKGRGAPRPVSQSARSAATGHSRPIREAFHADRPVSRRRSRQRPAVVSSSVSSPSRFPPRPSHVRGHRPPCREGHGAPCAAPSPRSRCRCRRCRSRCRTTAPVELGRRSVTPPEPASTLTSSIGVSSSTSLPPLPASRCSLGVFTAERRRPPEPTSAVSSVASIFRPRREPEPTSTLSLAAVNALDRRAAGAAVEIQIAGGIRYVDAARARLERERAAHMRRGEMR